MQSDNRVIWYVRFWDDQTQSYTISVALFKGKTARKSVQKIPCGHIIPLLAIQAEGRRFGQAFKPFVSVPTVKLGRGNDDALLCRPQSGRTHCGPKPRVYRFP